ncbi:hypothetical protein ccbrp13_08810 [Ktedonobacteria bacterium brp13]|nr:hypothetical protein ccbrp13_08810 [Ktedonobacteria bacterium brp13]
MQFNHLQWPLDIPVVVVDHTIQDLLQRIADPTRPVRQITMHGKLVERGSSESRSSLRY